MYSDHMILVVDIEPQVVMDNMASQYDTLKPGCVVEPTFYLRHKLANSTVMAQIIQRSPGEPCLLRNISSKPWLMLKLPAHVSTKCSQYYQSLTSVLCWMICELGHLGILVVVSMLISYVVAPHKGHLQQLLFRVFAYLKRHTRSKVVFDDSKPVYDESFCKVCDWAEYYPDAAGEEAILHNAPMGELGTGGVVSSCFFVDSDHAVYKSTAWCSHTG